MTLRPLRVAAVQAASLAGHVEANVAAAAYWVEVAAGRGARVVVLPELFLTGYDPATWTAPDRPHLTVDDARLLPLGGAAEAAGVAVLVGAAVDVGGAEPTLSALCCTPDGGIDVAYSKQHLWAAERSVFAPGRAGGSIVIDGWHLGLGICYDGCFPEHARAAADAGALGYLCPSAYVVGSEHRRDLYYAARALDNGVYVVLAGLTGQCGELTFSGGTAIYDPQGRRVAAVSQGDGCAAESQGDGFAAESQGDGCAAGSQGDGFAAEQGEGLAVADLDPAAITEARAINPYAEDRLASLGGRVTTQIPNRVVRT